MAPDYSSMTERQLRDCARQLDYDAEALLDPARKRAARVQHGVVVEELRSRYAKAHPVKTGVTRVLAKLLGADTQRVERHLRSAGRDEI